MFSCLRNCYNIYCVFQTGRDRDADLRCQLRQFPGRERAQPGEHHLTELAACGSPLPALLRGVGAGVAAPGSHCCGGLTEPHLHSDAEGLRNAVTWLYDTRSL